MMKLKKDFFMSVGLCLLMVGCSSFPMVHPTGKIVTGIYVIMNTRPFVNFYIFSIGEKYIAIDAGTNSTQSIKKLKKLSISPDDVVAAFITHSHYDHIGALELFDNAAVYTGNTTIPEINNHVMLDGEILELYGMTIKCIYTPGHTNDSVCYLINGKYLFVGDTLINHSNNADNELRKLSVEKLAKIDGVEFIFSGHYGFTSNVKRVLSQ